MPTLIERLESDTIAAMKAKSPTLTTLRFLRSAIKNEEIIRRAKSEVITEQIVLQILRRELKKRQEASALYISGGRPELAQIEDSEAAVIMQYLPAAPSDQEVMAIAKKLMSELGLSGASARGQLTRAVMEHFQGAAEGKVVSSAVLSIIS